LLGILGLILNIQGMKKFVVQNENYHSRISYPHHQIVICDRTHHYVKSDYIDTFGPSWNIIIANGLEARIRSGDQWIFLNGSSALFVPAFAVVEFHITPGIRQWTSVMCLDESITGPRQNYLLQESVVAPNDLKSLKELLFRFENKGVPLIEQRSPSAVAEIFKTSLAETLADSVKIQELCEKHGYCRRVVGRAFKVAYGMSPVEYRHRIRIFAVLRLMAKGFSITDSISEIGISEPKQFLIQFKRFLEKVPNEIKISAKKEAAEKMLMKTYEFEAHTTI
jgi:AraC-like DNA-binding protein